MSLHKLTAGDGYTYLTRQVAVQDATDRGASGLADYYAEKGESPGRWWGSGLEGLNLARGATVTEAQMKSLFGEGRHPDAEARRLSRIGDGASPDHAEAATRIGQPFRVASCETEFARRVAASYVEHNRDRGTHWSASIDPQTRAVLRTRVAGEMFLERYGRRPADDRERHGFVAQESRQRTTSVAGFDLTFTPVKSVSALWALAGTKVAGEIERAHAAAVQDTLAWLEANVLLTRHGHGGARQVTTRGLIATVFTHRDSRAGDPNLHSHVAVSNKVQDASGRWLAVDARVLYKANVTLSEHYNTRLEAELISRLGLRFEDADRIGDRGRPVREVVGIDPRLAAAWSRRRRDIDNRRGDLIRQFQQDHGRPPTPTETIALSQQANLETREAKHEPRSEQDQRAAWAGEAARVLGSRRAVRLMVSRCLSPRALQRSSTASAEWVALTAAQVVSTVEASRATWQTWHLRAEAERQARYVGLPLPQLDSAVDAVVRRATEVESIPLGDPDPAHRDGFTPPALQRDDGASVYLVHGSRRFTSQRILDAERSILDAAGRCDGRVVPADRIRDFVHRRRTSAAEAGLAEEQLDLVARLAGTGPRVQVALAPAGSGKTTCMQALADLWISNGGKVLGLAPSAAAAHQLRESLRSEDDRPRRPIACDTLAKLAWEIDQPGGASEWPMRIDDSTLVIIDEAGMAGTLELAAVIQYVVERGASVRLVGDDRQLASVAAGGIVRDIADRYGAASLTETRRFSNPVEGAATLALRDGDPIALAFYADHQRLHVGDPQFCAEQAYDAWRADLAAGRSSVLIAPNHELVTELNTRAQCDRLTTAGAPPDDPVVDLADGTRARAGDVVITRRNDRRLTTSAVDWVKNGDRWTVAQVNTDGSLYLRHIEQQRGITVPAHYVGEYVTLGYATTIHGAQGMTVDTAHAVLTGDEERALVYVALTRGRHANHAYVAVTSLEVGGSGRPGSDGTTWHDTVTRPETLSPPTAVEILASVLAREADSHSASTASVPDAVSNQVAMLQTATDRYRDGLYVAAEQHLGRDAVDNLTSLALARLPGLTDEPAWDALRSNLLLAAVDFGTEPGELLAKLIDKHTLDGARDAAAVLAARLADQLDVPATRQVAAPLPWLPPVPASLAAAPTWRRYLDERRDWVASLAARIAQAADVWSPDTPANETPTWARPLLTNDDPTLIGDLTIWRAVEGIAPTDLTPTGGTRKPGAAGRHQAELQRRAEQVLARRDRTDLPSLPARVRSDPWLPHLHTKLDELARSGIDIARTLEAALDDERPLPSEVPAAALWWRAQNHLDEAVPNDAPDEPGMQIQNAPDPRWAVHSETTYGRIVAIHELALRYYAQMYDRSWTPNYLANRFYQGWENDLDDLQCGYAPPGPFSLGRHLLTAGVTEQELVDAGLARRQELNDGGWRLIDTFRDRAVFPLHDPRRPEHVVGFVGRRNPAKDQKEYAGPKYLNTRTTAAYAKSDNLFGLDQLASRPAARAAVVEGPLDALAVTLATRGTVVGVSPLGTALTDLQVDHLARHHRQGRGDPVLMFDDDEAGGDAASRAAEGFARERLAFRVAQLGSGSDPCQMLHDLGAASLQTAIRQATQSETPAIGPAAARPHRPEQRPRHQRRDSDPDTLRPSRAHPR